MILTLFIALDLAKICLVYNTAETLKIVKIVRGGNSNL
jgi:hypothetical protein